MRTLNMCEIESSNGRLGSTNRRERCSLTTGRPPLVPPNCQEHPHTERAISRCCGGRAVVGLPLGARGDVGAFGALAAAPARALGNSPP